MAPLTVSDENRRAFVEWVADRFRAERAARLDGDEERARLINLNLGGVRGALTVLFDGEQARALMDEARQRTEPPGA